MADIKAFFAKVADFVMDKNGGADEKRLLGVLFAIAALVYVFTRPASTEVWTVAGGMVGFAGIMLGIAGAQDGVGPKQ